MALSVPHLYIGTKKNTCSTRRIVDYQDISENLPRRSCSFKGQDIWFFFRILDLCATSLEKDGRWDCHSTFCYRTVPSIHLILWMVSSGTKKDSIITDPAKHNFVHWRFFYVPKTFSQRHQTLSGFLEEIISGANPWQIESSKHQHRVFEFLRSGQEFAGNLNKSPTGCRIPDDRDKRSFTRKYFRNCCFGRKTIEANRSRMVTNPNPD